MSTTIRRLVGWCSAARVTSAALVLLVAAGWWAFLRPSSLGGPLTLVTVTGVSMQPNFHTGDLAVMFDTDSYERGDVVAFRAETVPGQPGAYVIHRIVDGHGASGYVTRGDNNGWDDPWRPSADDVAGELWFAVPGAGTAVQWLAQPVHMAALMAAFAASMVVLGGGAEASAGPNRRNRRNRRHVRRRVRGPATARHGVRLSHSGTYVGGAAVGMLAVLAAGSGALPGSAAHLEVDAGVLQVFELDGPASQPQPFGECGDRDAYRDLVRGTPGDDVLRGGNHPQIIVGRGGDDTIYGGTQADCLLGGAGDDELHGGNGKDMLVGGPGDDICAGGRAPDEALCEAVAP